MHRGEIHGRDAGLLQERHGNESNAGIDCEIAFVDMIALRKEAASKQEGETTRQPSCPLNSD